MRNVAGSQHALATQVAGCEAVANNEGARQQLLKSWLHSLLDLSPNGRRASAYLTEQLAACRAFDWLDWKNFGDVSLVRHLTRYSLLPGSAPMLCPSCQIMLSLFCGPYMYSAPVLLRPWLAAKWSRKTAWKQEKTDLHRKG